MQNSTVLKPVTIQVPTSPNTCRLVVSVFSQGSQAYVKCAGCSA